MSRFDYKDPGTDPAYCDQLAASDYAHCQICNDTVLVYDDMPEDEPVICDRCKSMNPTPDPRSADDNARKVGTLAERIAAAIDPAEHACHALIDALTTLEQQIALCGDKDLERANQLRTMLHRHEQYTALVLNKAAAKVDEILERLR